MGSLIPLAGPVACAGLMGGMMWWMMRGTRGNRAAAHDADSKGKQILQLQEENARLRAREVSDPDSPSIGPRAEA